MPYSDPAEKARKQAAHRAGRRQELAAAQRARYRADRERIIESNRAYLDAHPDVRLRVRFANSSNRRARRWGVPGKLYGRDLVSGRPCAYCSTPADSWDHVIPMSWGGPNTLDNLVPCCRPCNRRKSRRDRDRQPTQPYIVVWLLLGWRPSDWPAIADTLAPDHHRKAPPR